MQTVILCGGKGTRAYPDTIELPKPLLPVAGEPVLLHTMRIYAEQGYEDFILAAGFLAEKIADFARGLPSSWQVEVVDTGPDTNTAGRILRCQHLLDGTFLANYADGLGNVDIPAVVAFHHAHPAAGTLVTVPLPSQYGTVEFDGDGRIERFREKPKLPDHWINGGYFVFEPAAFDHWAGEDLERDVLPALAAAGELYAYQHRGFWKSMDTYKDALELSALADSEQGAPWAVTSRARASS
jgi:glucose-1-phosphate cytidylyltransferase